MKPILLLAYMIAFAVATSIRENADETEDVDKHQDQNEIDEISDEMVEKHIRGTEELQEDMPQKSPKPGMMLHCYRRRSTSCFRTYTRRRRSSWGRRRRAYTRRRRSWGGRSSQRCQIFHTAGC